MSWVMSYMLELNKMMRNQVRARAEYERTRLLRKSQLAAMNNNIKIINASYNTVSSTNTGSTTVSAPSIKSVALTDDNDNHKNTTEYCSINGGSGNDTISNSAKHATILGGDGNDTISGVATGNYITNLQISGDTFSSVVVGEDVILKIGDGSITIKDGKTVMKNLEISGTYKDPVTGAYRITENLHDTTVETGDGNDYIKVGSNNVIFSYSGNDHFYNDGSYNTIYSGDGDDTIRNNPASNSNTGTGAVLFGDAGKDSISITPQHMFRSSVARTTIIFCISRTVL